MSRGTLATISTSALQHNFQQVKTQAPNAKIWSVVKANAYGHDALAVAKILNASDGFAVSTLDEGLALREAGIDQPILLLEGVTQASHLATVAKHGMHCVLHCPEQLVHLAQVRLADPLRVWLKIDTGMHRLGFAAATMAAVVAQLADHPDVQLVGLMTHLASADDERQDAATRRQIALFQESALPAPAHSIANSAAILRHQSSHADWVRPGIMLYGASPVAALTAAHFKLRPVMSFMTPVIALRTIEPGEQVGYGLRWQAQRPTRIATLAAGYGDGYPRHAPDGTPVWLNGQQVPLVGRVSMDMLTVDASDLPALKVGDMAELWGQNLSVDQVASHIGTIGYELLTRLSPRVPVKVVE